MPEKGAKDTTEGRAMRRPRGAGILPSTVRRAAAAVIRLMYLVQASRSRAAAPPQFFPQLFPQLFSYLREGRFHAREALDEQRHMRLFCAGRVQTRQR